MPRVDFYILDDVAADARLTLACRIAEKAMRLDQKVLINADSRAEAARLDDLLWTFSQGSFVPHRVVEPGSPDGIEPVLIVCGHDAGDRADVMINLAADIPDFADRYERIAELVDGDADRRSRGRERFRRYRERGCELDTHRM